MGSTTKLVDVLPPATSDVFDSTAYNAAVLSSRTTIAGLPFAIQVAFQQKLLAILAMQFFAVGVVAGVLEWDGTVENFVRDHVVSSAGAVIAAVVSLLVLLVVLHSVRLTFPVNWIVLALFSCAQVLCLLCIDVAVDSHVAVANCGFMWTTVLLLMGLTKWTKRPAEGSQGSLRSPYLLGLIAFVGVCLPSAVVYAVDNSILQAKTEIAISLVVQVFVGVWFCSELEKMHKKLSPDEYMSGVILFYTDLLVTLAVGVLCATNASSCVAVPPEDEV